MTFDPPKKILDDQSKSALTKVWESPNGKEAIIEGSLKTSENTKNQ